MMSTGTDYDPAVAAAVAVAAVTVATVAVPAVLHFPNHCSEYHLLATAPSFEPLSFPVTST
jgi:hypothetical protein